MKRELLWILVALVAATLACSSVVVSNTGADPVIVELNMPDGSFYTRRFDVGDSQNYTVSKGGILVAQVLPDQQYIDKLKNLRDGLVTAMVTGESGGPDLLKAFTAVQTEIRALEDSSGIECTAEVPEEVPEGESSIFYIDVTYREGGRWECGISQP